MKTAVVSIALNEEKFIERWAASAAETPNSLNSYTLTIIKTGINAYIVLGPYTLFA